MAVEVRNLTLMQKPGRALVDYDTSRMNPVASITTRPNPQCRICGSSGGEIYHALTDSNFGEWNIRACDNSECRLLWLDPVPTENDIGKAYKVEYHTHHEPEVGLEKRIKRGYLAAKLNYTDRGGVVEKTLGLAAAIYPATRRVIEFPARYLTELPRGRLLDMGCGAGEMLSFAQAMGWDAEGVDFDPLAVQFARERKLRVQLGTLEAQRYGNGYFHVVLLSHVIEHVHDPLALLGEIRRVMVPGGHLFCATPNGSSWGHRMMGASWDLLDPPRHLSIFSVPSMRRVCTDAGFSNVSIHTSIRGAYRVFAKGRLERADGNNSSIAMAASRIHSLRMTLEESVRLLRDKSAGEEIDVIAVN
jgi:2-polyprenyl-3-methyl-5-hydroxy-6-metoxy-1,4-benzoquinol methylase